MPRRHPRRPRRHARPRHAGRGRSSSVIRCAGGGAHGSSAAHGSRMTAVVVVEVVVAAVVEVAGARRKIRTERPKGASRISGSGSTYSLRLRVTFSTDLLSVASRTARRSVTGSRAAPVGVLPPLRASPVRPTWLPGLALPVVAVGARGSRRYRARAEGIPARRTDAARPVEAGAVGASVQSPASGQTWNGLDVWTSAPSGPPRSRSGGLTRLTRLCGWRDGNRREPLGSALGTAGNRWEPPRSRSSREGLRGF